MDIYSKIREHYPSARLDLLTVARPHIDGDISDIYQIFNNVYFGKDGELSPEDVRAKGSEKPTIYDLVDFQFHEVGKYIREFRRISSFAIFTPMESQAKKTYNFLLRLVQTRSALKIKPFKQLITSTLEEIRWARDADSVICVSKSDATALRLASLNSRIDYLETGISELEFSPIPPRNNIYRHSNSVIFVASFESATNIEALLWYLICVHPKIKQRVPDYIFKIIGRGDLSFVTDFIDNNVEIVGSVVNLQESMLGSTVGVAPALSGAGFRGKINQYSFLEIPTVASPLASRGMLYRDGESILIGGTDNQFADKCVELLTDQQLRNQIALKANAICTENYSWKSKWGKIMKIYRLS